MRLKEIEVAVQKMDPGLQPDDEAYKATVVLLSSLEVGPHIQRLKKFTGYPRELLMKFSHFLRKNGVWRGGRVYADWFDEKEGAAALIMDSLVAQGMMERSR